MKFEIQLSHDALVSFDLLHNFLEVSAVPGATSTEQNQTIPIQTSGNALAIKEITLMVNETSDSSIRIIEADGRTQTCNIVVPRIGVVQNTQNVTVLICHQKCPTRFDQIHRFN